MRMPFQIIGLLGEKQSIGNACYLYLVKRLAFVYSIVLNHSVYRLDGKCHQWSYCAVTENINW